MHVTNFDELTDLLHPAPAAVGTLRLREAELAWLIDVLDGLDAADEPMRRTVVRELTVTLDMLRAGRQT